MSSILQEAIRSHQAGKLAEASSLYYKAIAQGKPKPSVFQNLGALLRQQNKPDEALLIYNQGLEMYPDNSGILSNRANILKEQQPVKALYDTLKAIEISPDLVNAWSNAIAILCDQDCYSYALHVARQALQAGCSNARVLVQILSLLDEVPAVASGVDQKLLDDFIQLIQIASAELEPLERADVLLGLGFTCAKYGHTQQALEIHSETTRELLTGFKPATKELQEKRDEVITNHSWNLGCLLLKEQDFTNGWKLYDYGLRVPTKTPQRWQRALRKHFSSDQLPVWRGESLKGRRLLLLEEQGIGDTMMFLTLVPTLAKEAAQVDLVLGNRLSPIYSRSLESLVNILSHEQISKGEVEAKDYDFQSALGSICQYRFTDISAYAPKVPMIHVVQEEVAQLRRSYIEKLGAPADAKLIGISWSGGATQSRVRAKSVPILQFEQLIQPLDGVYFISLQYGDVSARVEAWSKKGIEVFHDPEIDALIDMNSWVTQVAACDAVFSVANTTIHGAGGLNKPTLCLLSRGHDWRWLADSQAERSYWYPSVGITLEDKFVGWEQALLQCRRWIEDGCPMPSGPIHASEATQ